MSAEQSSVIENDQQPTVVIALLCTSATYSTGAKGEVALYDGAGQGRWQVGETVGKGLRIESVLVSVAHCIVSSHSRD